MRRTGAAAEMPGVRRIHNRAGVAVYDSVLLPLLEAQPPESLYHYTGAEGVIGILQSGTVWATAIQFLNDSQEFREAHRVACQLLWRRGREKGTSGAADIAEKIGEGLSGVLTANVCAFSLSERGDLLSQWRAYAPSGGYALGFSGGKVREAGSSQGFLLMPCRYQRDDHVALLSPLVNGVFDQVMATLSEGRDDVETVIASICKRASPSLTRLAPIVKHQAFEEEAEWRLVSGIVPRRNMQHRHSGGVVVPYTTIDLHPVADGHGRGVLTHVCVGPSPHPELASLALRSLSTAGRLRVGGWGPSSVPHRPI